jgi:magnesium chelatase family protein
MAFSVAYSRASEGLDAPKVTVEVHLSAGAPAFNIVGLPEAAVRESKDRVRSAIINSGFDFPKGRITVNLAPAELPKTGSRLDLAIAIAILQANQQVKIKEIEQCEFYGELALSGQIREVSGLVSALIIAKKEHCLCYISQQNEAEAALINSPDIIASHHLKALVAHLNGTQVLPMINLEHQQVFEFLDKLDLSEVKGQQHAKHALEIAAAGRHNLLFFGPPGTGKTLLASRLIGLLPPLTDQQSLEVASIYSVAGQKRTHLKERPYRAPHHTCSGVALVGGGANPSPGEISLAHHGILFLDEIPEFGRNVLDVLREPMESGEILISRAAKQVTFPAKFQLICALNPSPNGYAANDSSSHYSREEMQKYLARLSGPFLDRIDMQIEVPKLEKGVLTQANQSESSSVVRARVYQAWKRQFKRQGKVNNDLNNKELDTVAQIEKSAMEFLEQAMEKLGFSARSFHRLLKVARTIADLNNDEQVQKQHVAQALQMRQLEPLLKR